MRQFLILRFGYQDFRVRTSLLLDPGQGTSQQFGGCCWFRMLLISRSVSCDWKDGPFPCGPTTEVAGSRIDAVTPWYLEQIEISLGIWSNALAIRKSLYNDGDNSVTIQAL